MAGVEKEAKGGWREKGALRTSWRAEVDPKQDAELVRCQKGIGGRWICSDGHEM